MFQYALMNGIVIDGSGAAPRRANLYVSDGKIARITEEELPSADRYDAAGKAVSPGFIDIHTHSDLSPFGAPLFESYIHQGVTSSLCGNCGDSFVPHRPQDHDRRLEAAANAHFRGGLPDVHAMDTAGYLSEMTGRCANNVGLFVGHGALRAMCMANPNAASPTPAELGNMQDLLRRELEAGAFGLSLGLIYVPGVYSATEELISLAKVAAEYGAAVPIHMRSEADDIFSAVREVGRIGRESGAHVHISHFKIMSVKHWGKADELLAMADGVIREGIHLDFDQYPYLASATPLRTCLPGWVRRLSPDEQMALLADPALFARARPEIEADAHLIIGADRVLVSSTCGHVPEWDGLYLSEIADVLHVSPIEAYRQVMLESRLSARGCYFSMHREDALKIAARRDVAVVSDSTAVDMLSRGMVGVPHPRASGSFARFLRLNRELHLMPIEWAVFKMTGLPAAQMGIAGRGTLREGSWADITVFDPETVTDNGTFSDPGRPAGGIDRVMLNGEWVWMDGRHTGAVNGRGLRRGPEDACL